MSGWLKIQEGHITLVHHSPASVIEVIVDYPNESAPTSIWLDYYEWEDLKKAIQKSNTKDK